ncbi:hypothetical protein JTE90_020916 [Oedothorax gibbosus]|uniref:Uncharacterized protein n=1 Tax=Oedothorax gibbosus TaxID=931172 RepID=A0AAV6VMP8_9ARAC|nr:hypothetical protein JTE90_020916 [Oedothorax gibbosus]
MKNRILYEDLTSLYEVQRVSNWATWKHLDARKYQRDIKNNQTKEHDKTTTGFFFSPREEEWWKQIPSDATSSSESPDPKMEPSQDVIPLLPPLPFYLFFGMLASPRPLLQRRIALERHESPGLF